MLPDRAVINGILFAVVFLIALSIVWGCKGKPLPHIEIEQAEKPSNILGVR